MINATILSIANDQTNNFINQVKDNLARTGTDATKKSSNSIYKRITEDGYKLLIEVLAKPYFSVVETGRKPTPEKKPSRDMIQNITEWVAVRGKPESAVWAIAVSIQKKGTSLFRRGGRTDIYTDDGDEYAEDMFSAITKAIAKEEMDLIIKGFELK
jgi:hypothetical protein